MRRVLLIIRRAKQCGVVSVSALMTIGYEGRTVDDVVSRLQANAVEIVIDVRWTPISRKPGFSKSALRAAVERVGMRYIHVQLLGAPKQLRADLYAEGRYKEFFTEYRKHLDKNIPALQEAAALLKQGNACLLCFERHPQLCHRHVLVEKLGRQSGGPVKVMHL